jgi:large subunit ribosomal protein L24
MKIIKGDKVKIIAGKDKGKIATVIKAIVKDEKLIVEGVNMIKKHVKPNAVYKEGGIITMEKPVHISNVMYYSEKHKRPVRIGYTIVDGKKFRVIKPFGDVLDSKVKSTTSTEKTKTTKKSAEPKTAKKEGSDKVALKKKAEKK